MGQTKLTRRQWAGALAAAQGVALPAPAAAQTPQAADSPAESLTQAKQSVVRNREALARFKIGRSLEPATRYEAH
jgi:hypothetical protein